MSNNEKILNEQMVIYAKELKSIYEEERAKRKELERTNRRLRELDEMKTTFFEIVSQELRTPVTIINAYLDLISQTLIDRLGPQENEFFFLAREQGLNLGTFIENITNFTHIARGEPIANTSEQESNNNLAALIKNQLKKLENQIQANELQVICNLPENLPPANLEPGRFKVIVIHLLNKAIRFNQLGGYIKIDLFFEGETEVGFGSQTLILKIEFSGTDIRPEKVEQIFETFRNGESLQTDSFRELSLGLALVYHTVSSFRGELTLTSETDKSTTFCVKVPYVAWQDPEQLFKKLQQLQSINLVYAQDLKRLYEDEKEKNIRLASLSADLEEKQNRLNLFLKKLLTAQEEERRKVSADLHDGLAQILTFAHQMIELTEVEAPDTVNSKSFGRAKDSLKSARQEVRRMVAGLRPDVLDRFGLVPALRDYFSTMVREQGWEATFDIVGDFGEPGKSILDPVLEDNYYRITQEALSNIRKHADSKKVLVRLIHEPGEVILQIRDWGKGFNIPKKNSRSRSKNGQKLDGEVPSSDNAANELIHFGLVGIEERIRLLGGTLNLQSKPGYGTTLTVTVPFVEPS